MPKYFFSGLPNLLSQKIRLPLISFFSGVNYIWGITYGEAPKGTGSDSKNLPDTAHTDRHTTVAFSGVTENDLLWAGVCPGRPALPCPAPALPCPVCHHRQTPCLLLYIG
jgi:hypothetical protein